MRNRGGMATWRAIGGAAPATRRAGLSLRAALLLLVLLATLPALGLVLVHAAEEWQRVRAQMAGEADRLVAVTAADYGDVLARAEQTLAVLAETPQVRAADPVACPALLNRVRAAQAIYTAIWVAGPDGGARCTDSPSAGSIADRDYFQLARATGAFAVGAFRIGAATGKPVLPVALPLRDGNGGFGGVVAAGIDLTALPGTLGGRWLPPGGVALLLDRAGAVLVRHPAPAARIGQRDPDTPLIQLVLAQRAGTAEIDGLDGERRLYAFRPLGGGDGSAGEPVAYAVIGLPLELKMAAQAAALRTQLAELTATALLALLVAWAGGWALAGGQLGRLRMAAQRLAGGDWAARAGPSGGLRELAELADAFDRMAAELAAAAAARERAAAALVEREARLRAIIETAVDAILTVDERGTIETANPAVERLFGYTPAELIGRDVGILMTEPDRAAHAGHLARYQATGERRVIGIGRQVTGRRKDGTTFPLDLSVAETDLGGRRVYTGILHDMSEQVAALEREREARLLLDAVVEHLPHMLVVKEAAGLRFVLFNRAGERLLGMERAALLGRCDHDLFPAEQADAFVAADRAVLASGEVVEIAEEPIATAAGERLLRTLKVAVAGAGGRPAYLLGISEDITERRAAERALAESEARYRALVEQAGDIIYTIDLAGRFTTVNPAGQRVTGYSPDELIGLPIDRVIAPADLAKARAMMAAKLRGEADVTTYMLDILTKDGRRLPLEVTSRLLCDAAGAPVGVLGIARDLSERRAAEAERERLLGELQAALAAERAARAAAEAATAALKASQAQLVQAGKLAAVGTLAAGVAHELNQPLMVIRGQTQLLLANGDDPERRAQKLARIEKQTEKMATIIDHLRAFGRPRPARPAAPVDLNQVIEEALLLIGAQLAERGIDLQLALAKPAPIALADAGEVEQIVLNLLINARDALAPGGALAGLGAVVTVRTWADGGAVHLAVLDTGPGLSPAVQARLFEPFFTTKEPGHGTGLGLSISRDLARKWGGELTLANREAGPGAIATLTLPAAPATVASSAV